MKKYNDFIKENIQELNIPDEIKKSSIDIIKSMYSDINNITFNEENGKFFIQFEISPDEFNLIDPSEVLQMDISDDIKYYVELEFDNKLEDNKVSYRIIYEQIKS